MMKKNIIILILALLAVLAVFGASYYVAKKAPKQVTEEAYRVVASETDGPEQIFEKAFTQYSEKHGTKVTADELRKVAEYMAANNLNGKAFWTDANGVRHELWIGTGDELVMRKNTSTFTISNAITEKQKKTVTINFGFEEALTQLEIIRITP